MYKSIISIYINNLTYDDVVKYIDSNYDGITLKEKDIIYKYIKQRWEDIYYNRNNVFDDIKGEVSSYTYSEIIKLYNKYSYYIK